MTHPPREPETAIPEDIRKKAEAVTKMMPTAFGWRKITDEVAKAIHDAVVAERERCAGVADWYSQASVHVEWTDEARSAGYYACADVARDIRIPQPINEPSPQAIDADDDLPF